MVFHTTIFKQTGLISYFKGNAGKDSGIYSAIFIIILMILSNTAFLYEQTSQSIEQV